MRLASLLLAAGLSCAAASAAAEHIKGADRQLDRFSPLVRELQDKPAPPNWDELQVMATLMAYAHDTDTARGLSRLLEREALLEVLGEPLPPRAPKVELVVYEMARAEKAIDVLRDRVLAAPVGVEVIAGHEEGLAPDRQGETFRHEGGSVWNSGNVNYGRAIGVKLTNTGNRRILRGRFELDLGTARNTLRFLCNYTGPLEPGASKAVLCFGNGTVPYERVAEAIRIAASGFTPAARHFEVAYELRGDTFEVKPGEIRYGKDHFEYERRAMAMIQAQGCGARGACGAAVKEGLEDPFLLGLLVGIVAGFVLLLVEAAFGKRAAAVTGGGMAVVLLAVMAVGVLAALVFGGKVHLLYALIFAGQAVSVTGALAMGVIVGVVGSIFAVAFAAKLWRRARGG
jgi:hypothetical protein